MRSIARAEDAASEVESDDSERQRYRETEREETELKINT